ncbi:MAG: DoxX family protein [Planctomycetota bacterium]|nr:MAG: DoxX family protein [Planctomycetota bacterium]
MRTPLRKLVFDATASRSVILIRLMVGLVFVSEGLQKFLFPGELGPGRFDKMGFAQPNIAYFVAVFELTCGALLIPGLLTRAAAIPLIIDMTIAIVTTKLPILAGHDLWGFHVRKLPEYGFWAMAHESRTDWAMLLGSIFLLIVGAGRWSIDAVIQRPSAEPAETRK